MHVKRGRTGQLGVQLDAEQGRALVLDVDSGGELHVEAERVEHEQGVVADVALDGEAASRRVELHRGAELVAVGRDSHVRGTAQLHVVAGADADSHPAQRGESGRRLVAGVEAAQGHREVGVVAPVQPQRHVAGQLVEKDVGVIQRAVDRQLVGAEVQRAEDVDLDEDERGVVVGQRHVQAAEQRDPHRVGDLHEHADLERDQGRGAPADLQHRAEHVAAVSGRENRADVADYLRSVRDRVGREQDRVEVVGAHRGVQRVEDHRPVDTA